jgi:hypothetical protein
MKMATPTGSKQTGDFRYLLFSEFANPAHPPLRATGRFSKPMEQL